MSTETIEKNDTLELIELEERFGQTVPCAHKEIDGCEAEAKWRATMITCGHQFNVCNRHRALMLAAMVGQTKWVCAQSGVPINDIDWSEL